MKIIRTRMGCIPPQPIRVRIDGWTDGNDFYWLAEDGEPRVTNSWIVTNS